MFLKYRFFVLNFKKVSRRHTVDFCSLPETTKKMQNPSSHKKKNITNHNNNKLFKKKLILLVFLQLLKNTCYLTSTFPKPGRFFLQKKKHRPQRRKRPKKKHLPKLRGLPEGQNPQTRRFYSTKIGGIRRFFLVEAGHFVGIYVDL